MSHILVVDDDPSIREVITFKLESAGHNFEEAGNGQEALDLFQARGADLIILDVGMPEMDGFELCRRIRQSSEVPILFLTARNDEIDRVLGLELGGDDYVAKPFSPRELMARVKAILKRGAPATQTSQALTHGDLSLDLDAHQCRLGTCDIRLTSSEFSILAALMKRPAHVLSKRQLMDAVYHGNIHVSDRTLDSHIRNLRAKLSEAGCPKAIETIHGVGLRMDHCGA